MERGAGAFRIGADRIARNVEGACMWQVKGFGEWGTHSFSLLRAGWSGRRHDYWIGEFVLLGFGLRVYRWSRR